MSCLNLRKGPSKKYPIITCVAGNDHNTEGEVRVKVLSHKENWAKVEVTTWIMDQTIKEEEFEDGPCSSILKSKRIGWFKVVDDSGFPNLWYASGGY